MPLCLILMPRATVCELLVSQTQKLKWLGGTRVARTSQALVLLHACTFQGSCLSQFDTGMGGGITVGRVELSHRQCHSSGPATRECVSRRLPQGHVLAHVKSFIRPSGRRRSRLPSGLCWKA